MKGFKIMYYNEDKWADKFKNVHKDIKNEYRKIGKCKEVPKEVNSTCCYDNYVGYFEKYGDMIIGKESLWFCRRLRDENSENINITPCRIEDLKKDGKIVVIVLESPHKDEYDIKLSSNAPAPALGRTGGKLNKLFLELFKCKVKFGKYHVILMNSIQYQCSFGEKPDKFRDRVWLKLWLCENFAENFISRLEAYKPDIIINLCTLGSHKEDSLAVPGTKTVINEKYIKSICNDKNKYPNGNNTIKDLVQLKINEYVEIVKKNESRPIKCYIGSHPSSSRFNKIEKYFSVN
jgi:hypothetical protein